MKILLYASTAALGAFVALHLIMNAMVGRTTGNPRLGNAIFWGVGAVIAIALALSGWQDGALAKMKEVPLWLWLAGGLGACIMYSVVLLIPEVGPGSFQILLLLGQIIFGLVIAHYGFLGFPVDRITGLKAVGVCVMVVGAYFAIGGKIPFLDV